MALHALPSLTSSSRCSRPLRFDEGNLRDLIRLRDMYFVYTDSLHHCVQGLKGPTKNRSYRHGPIDMQVKVVRHTSTTEYVTAMHHPLRHVRDQREQPVRGRPHGTPLATLALPARHCAMTTTRRCRSPSTAWSAFPNAANEIFRSLYHTTLGTRGGGHGAVPAARAREAAEGEAAHGLKGARLLEGPPHPVRVHEQAAAVHELKAGEAWGVAPQDKEMQERTVLLLFLDGVTGVDDPVQDPFGLESTSAATRRGRASTPLLPPPRRAAEFEFASSGTTKAQGGGHRGPSRAEAARVHDRADRPPARRRYATSTGSGDPATRGTTRWSS